MRKDSFYAAVTLSSPVSLSVRVCVVCGHTVAHECPMYNEWMAWKMVNNVRWCTHHLTNSHLNWCRLRPSLTCISCARVVDINHIVDTGSNQQTFVTPCLMLHMDVIQYWIHKIVILLVFIHTIIYDMLANVWSCLFSLIWPHIMAHLPDDHARPCFCSMGQFRLLSLLDAGLLRIGISNVMWSSRCIFQWIFQHSMKWNVGHLL